MAGEAGDIEWVYLDRADEGEVRQGELISADAGGMPIYRVISLSNGRAWLKDLRDGADRVCPLEEFHWKALLANRR
ncbi:MAG: hypothetical protein JO111_16935 [Caulobacteraceae bacterium]|nr:hypothetical protein [Caulobacteraceae bacterium]